jgi:hypothetical protein
VAGTQADSSLLWSIAVVVVVALLGRAFGAFLRRS